MGRHVTLRRLLFGAAAVAGILGAWWLLSAVATADLRFAECGTSTLQHRDPYCRVAVRLLYQSYASLAAGALLLGWALSVRRRRHRRAT